MAKTVERTQPGGTSSKDTGRQLRQVRRKQGLSRTEVARSAGLTRRELAAYERGRIVIPESDLWCLAGSCGVDVDELLPGREPLKVGSGLASLAMGDSIRRLRDPAPSDGILREYLSMVYELRNLPPGSRVPLREPDLVALADALGGTPGAIEGRLVELIGASQDEAARLRAMILPPLSLSPAPQPGSPAPQPGDTSVYSSFGTPDPESPVVDFFSAPRAQDPFSPQPSPVATPTPAMAADPPTPGTPAPAAVDNPFDPLVPGEPSEPASDPFAVPMPTLRPDPFGLTPPAPNGRDQIDGIDGFVVDVLEGPLTDAAVAYAVPDDAATDWTGLRDAAAVADAPPAAVLRDGDRVDTTIASTTTDNTTTDNTTTGDSEPEPLDTAPILWRAPHDTTATNVVPGVLHTPASVAPFLPAGTGWQIGGLFPATSMADDGALALRRADTRWALSDLVAAGDVTIEVVLDYRAGAGFGVLFRASVDEHERVTGYSFDLDPATSGGGYLLQQWADNRPHWRPIVQVPVTDPAGLYGRHIVALTVHGDRLTVCVDAETVLTVAALSRASIDLGREACRGDGLGVHAGATTELTVETFRAAQP